MPKGTRPSASAGLGKPPRPVPISAPDDAMEPSRHKPKVPELEKDILDQLSTEEQNSLNSKFQEAKDAEKKVDICMWLKLYLQRYCYVVCDAYVDVNG